MNLSIGHRTPRGYGRALEREGAHVGERPVGLIDAEVAGCSSCQVSAYRKAQKTAARVGGLFGPDVKASGAELVSVLQDAVNQLSVDITQDGCADFYTAECKGTSPAVDALEKKLADYEASGKTLDAVSVLNIAGVTASDANVAAFAACGATFVASLERFVSQYETETSSALGDPQSLEPQLAKQLSQYNAFRTQFLDAGGQTRAPSIGEPLSWPATIAIGVAVAGGVYLLAQILLRKYFG